MKITKEKFTTFFTSHENYLKISISFFLVTIFCLIFFIGGGLLYFRDDIYVDGFVNFDFQVHVIDVGQGDAILIKLPSNKTLLIDCGEAEYTTQVISYINQYMKNENLNKIDYFILTHSDADHVGSGQSIIENFDVENIYRPKIYSIYEEENGLNIENYNLSTSQIYNNVIESAYENNCNLIFSQKDIILQENGCKIEFLSPSADNYSKTNNYSAVIMITYQDKKFLFTGDAETDIEQQLINDYGSYLKADVLKVGHHGSKTSSSQEFLNIVKPSFALLCTGENSNNLPDVSVLNRLHDINANILSTEELGSYALAIRNNEIIISYEPQPICDMVLLFSIFIVILLIVWACKFSWFKS